MAFVSMALAVAGQIASSSEYNNVVNNVLDLDARVTGLSVNRPYCHVYQSSTGTQTLAASTPVAINFDAEVIDPSGFHSTVSNTSRITPTVAGRYLLIGGVVLNTSVSTTEDYYIISQFRKNGAQVLGSSPYERSDLRHSGFVVPMATTSGSMVANGTTDYFQLYGNTNWSGGINTFSNATDQHSFAICLYMGPT